MTRWIEVWCQGGEADGYRYETLMEPPERIVVMPDPKRAERWIRVVDEGWPDAIVYERQPDVEQFEHERIYYPVSWT